MKFAWHFNKSSPTAAHLCKLEKRTFLTGSVLDMKQFGNCRNSRMSVFVCRNQFFNLPENPQRNDQQNYIFQEPPTVKCEFCNVRYKHFNVSHWNIPDIYHWTWCCEKIIRLRRYAERMHIPAATHVCHDHLFHSLFWADIDGSLLSSPHIWVWEPGILQPLWQIDMLVMRQSLMVSGLTSVMNNDRTH